ncbi:MAG: hypothetical protein OEW72_00320 [Gammaproteobacteria bacterium]|nr:hypothetical protein [Gammaproteobacteria bacterium]
MNRKAASLILAVMLGATPLAHSSPVQWTLNNVVFNDGGSATGSFTYDADLNTYSAIAIVTSPGSAFGGWFYDGYATDQPQTATQLVARNGTGPTFAGTTLLALRPDSALTNAGGVRNLLAGTSAIVPGGSFEVVCAVAGACAAPPNRLVVAGTLSGAVVPVPGALALLGSALGALAWVRRRDGPGEPVA